MNTPAGCTRRARVDAIDEYLETIVKKGDRFYYKYGERRASGDRRPTIKVPYKTGERNGREEHSRSIALITVRSSRRSEGPSG